jgi:hypothetical protein
MFFNNAGSAFNEGVEVAGVAGTDLSGFLLVLYDGASGQAYDTIPLGGVIAADSAHSGWGTLWYEMPAGMADGGDSPSGVALVRSNPPPVTVVQFLSYGGQTGNDTFVAMSGPATGLATTPTGVHVQDSSDSGGAVGGHAGPVSAILVGHGADYGDFHWVDSSIPSPGAVNAGETFGTSPAPPPPPPAPQSSTTIFINEIQYKKFVGTGSEGIEIAGPAGSNLNGLSLLLYDGSSGLTYDTVPLAGTIPDAEGSGMGALWIDVPNGIADGDDGPDGIALVQTTSSPAKVLQFISYGGSDDDDAFTALDGAAAGSVTTPIGIHTNVLQGISTSPLGGDSQNGGSGGGSETGGGIGSTTPTTVVLAGYGTTYSDFSWSTASGPTRGVSNAGQSFGAHSPIFLNEIRYGSAGNDGIEIAGPSGTDLTGHSVILYDGTTERAYTSIPITGVIGNDGESGYGALWFGMPPDGSGIRPGPAAVALADAHGAVVALLSYGPTSETTPTTFVVKDGPAAGLSTTPISVQGGDGAGSSTGGGGGTAPSADGVTLALTGTGFDSSDFVWSSVPGATTTPGVINHEQVFDTPPMNTNLANGTSLTATIGSQVAGLTVAGAAGVGAGSFAAAVILVLLALALLWICRPRPTFRSTFAQLARHMHNEAFASLAKAYEETLRTEKKIALYGRGLIDEGAKHDARGKPLRALCRERAPYAETRDSEGEGSLNAKLILVESGWSTAVHHHRLCKAVDERSLSQLKAVHTSLMRQAARDTMMASGDGLALLTPVLTAGALDAKAWRLLRQLNRCADPRLAVTPPGAGVWQRAQLFLNRRTFKELKVTGLAGDDGVGSSHNNDVAVVVDGGGGGTFDDVGNGDGEERAFRHTCPRAGSVDTVDSLVQTGKLRRGSSMYTGAAELISPNTAESAETAAGSSPGPLLLPSRVKLRKRSTLEATDAMSGGQSARDAPPSARMARKSHGLPEPKPLPSLLHGTTTRSSPTGPVRPLRAAPHRQLETNGSVEFIDTNTLDATTTRMPPVGMLPAAPSPRSHLRRTPSTFAKMNASHNSAPTGDGPDAPPTSQYL